MKTLARKRICNVWFHAIRLFKFLFWHVLIYQDNFNPIVEGNCANLFMVVCWWIHNFGFLYSGYHLVLTLSNNLYYTCWWACYNWWKLLRLYLVYFPFVIIESNGDHHSKLVSLSFTFAFLFFRASNVLIHCLPIDVVIGCILFLYNFTGTSIHVMNN